MTVQVPAAVQAILGAKKRQVDGLIRTLDVLVPWAVLESGHLRDSL